MTKETRIANLLFSAALAALFCLCSCTEKQHTTDPETPNLPVGFRPMSQAVMVKSGNNTFPHDDFGVWGIATEPLNEPYILWSDNALAQVSRVGETETFAPLADAYWLTGYEYHFLALAPFASGVTSLNINTTYAGNQLAAYPTMSFLYDMTSTYESKVYNYDLLGAAQYRKINTPSDKTEQDLMFWHLFSQIEISTSFSTDLSGNQIVGEVTAIHFKKVKTSGSYIVNYKTDSELDVISSSNTNPVKDISFSGSTAVFNIIPQDVKAFELYLDFKIQEGNVWKTYNNFKINLDVPANKDPYVYNNKYKWNISIGTRAAIKFDITVNEWQEATKENDGFDPEINM